MTHKQHGSDIRENTSRNTHNVVEGLLLQEDSIRKVLDVPCGEGAFTNRMLAKGIDVYAGDCENIIKAPDAKWVGCDMNQPLPFEDHEFDAIVCIDGIEHVERPFDFVRECSRVIRKEGALIVSTPNISSLRSRWRWFLTGFHNKGKTPLNEDRPSPLHHIGLLSFAGIRYMLHTNGFRIASITCNRIKAISWVYSFFVPFAYIITAWVFHKEEKDVDQRRRNKTILRQMFLKEVLFGETLIVKAVRCSLLSIHK